MTDRRPASRPLVLVPARSGSKGIPAKNLQPVGGVSLVGRAVLAGLDLVSRLHVERGTEAVLLVDTDDEGIAAEGRRWGGMAPFLRPPELARDETPTIDSALHALERATEHWGDFDCVVLLQPTSPLRRSSDVLACWTEFERARAGSVVSVSAAPHPIEIAMRQSPDGVLDWVTPPPGGIVRRQAYPESLFPNGAVFINSTTSLRTHRAFLVPGETRGVRTSPESAIDVDTPDDLHLADLVARGLDCLSGERDGASFNITPSERLRGATTR
jgi:CMP-N,N'-diacetyllegionaminic acid synthase